MKSAFDGEPFACRTSPMAFSGPADGPDTATFQAEDGTGKQGRIGSS